MRKGRRDLPAMLAGTVLVGVSGYVFLALIGHGRFDATVTAALSATYLIGNVLGPGIFVAAEQETSRVVSDALARFGSVGVAVRRLAAVDTGLAIASLCLLAVLTPYLLDRIFGGLAGLALALAVSVVGSAAVYLVRGLTGGQQRFGRYAATLLIDGGTRTVGCLFLVLIDNSDPVLYAVALCAGPGVAALLTFRGAGVPVGSGPPAQPVPPRTRELPVQTTPRFAVLIPDVALLLVASAMAMVLANLAPVVVTATLPGTPELAAGFAGAVVLTRVPLLFMGSVQAIILPTMTAAAAIDDRRGLRGTVVRGLLVIGAIGLVAALGTWFVGRPVLAILLGADRDTTGSGTLVLLTLSAVLFMAVQLLQPALVALRRHRALVLAWVAGGVAFALTFTIPVDPVAKGVLAQLIGPTVTLLWQLLVLGRYLRPPTDPTA